MVVHYLTRNFISTERSVKIWKSEIDIVEFSPFEGVEKLMYLSVLFVMNKKNEFFLEKMCF